MQSHWTDVVTSVEENSTVVVGIYNRQHRRERLERAHFVDEIVKFYGFNLSDWNGNRYLLSDKKGNTTIIENLGGIWAAAEVLMHRKPDPLDRELLAYLSAFKKL